MGENISNRLGNTAGKGEIARHEQFLFFFTMVSKEMYCRQVKQGLVLERVKEYLIRRAGK